MTLYTWDPNFSTGIDEIDAQHKQLLNLVNRLSEVIDMGETQQVQIRAMDKLVAYIYYHFDAEENFMRQCGYPESIVLEHQVIHQEFVKELAKEQLRCATDPGRISMELPHFLMAWLIDHILNVDKQMISANTHTGQSVDEPSACYLNNDTSPDSQQAFENWFIALVDRLPAFISLRDECNRLICCNRHWQHALGLTTRECSTDVWLNSIHQDDRDRLLTEYARAFTERSVLQIEYRLTARNGTCLWILETAAPRMLDNDEFAGLVSWGINISRQKQVEAALALSIKQLEETVAKQTQELQQTRVAFSQEKEAYKALNQKLNNDQAHLIQLGKMATTGQLAGIIAHEVSLPPDTLHVNLSTLKHNLRHMGIIVDIAERLAGQLPNDNPEVMAFNAIKKRQDTASLVDDLNGLADASIETANRIQKLARELYALSHAGQTDRTLFNIEEGLDAVLTILGSELNSKAEIIKEYAGIRPIYGVGSQLNLAFMNLLIIAADAIEGFGRITIKTGYKEAGWIWIEMEDTGKSLPEPVKSQIFEPFFSIELTEKALGLWLSSRIIEDHQGQLTVESAAGEGNRFRIYLPIA